MAKYTGELMPGQFRLYRRNYKGRDGRQHQTDNFYIDFRDHANVRNRWPLDGTEAVCEGIADRLMKLVECRQTGDSPSPDVFKWFDTLPSELAKRIMEADLIDASHTSGNKSLAHHLDGTADASGAIVEPGYKQHLEAKGGTFDYVRQTVMRIRRIIDGCSFATWRDVVRPGTPTKIRTFVAGLRTGKQGLSAKTAAYYIREFKSFAAWMKQDGRASHNPIDDMAGITHEDAEESTRRALAVDEMLLLLATTLEENIERFKMPANDRVLLYNFAYETGIRPKQIRSLTASNLRLDSDPPVVITSATHVKRRRRHEQPLTPRMAKLFTSQLATKMPEAPLFPTMPNKYKLAEMIRLDLADARAAWIAQAEQDPKEQLRRQRSDFLAQVNQQGDTIDFYSLRHTHGQTLGDKGASQKDIAASLHHSKTSTTDRYTINTTSQARQRTVNSLPDVLPQVMRKTGTDDVKEHPRNGVSEPVCAKTEPTGRNSAELDGVKTTDNMQKTPGLVAELADATDSKSVA